MELLSTSEINENIRGVLSNWAGEASIAHDAELNKNLNEPRNPFWNKEFERSSFKFLVKLSNEGIDFFKNIGLQSLETFGFNLLTSLDIFPAVSPEDIEVKLLIKAKKILFIFAEDEIWKVKEISKCIGDKITKVNILEHQLVEMVKSPYQKHSYKNDFWKGIYERRIIIKMFIKNLSQQVKTEISKNLLKYLHEKCEKLKTDHKKLENFLNEANYNSFADNIWDPDKDTNKVIVTLRKIIIFTMKSFTTSKYWLSLAQSTTNLKKKNSYKI